MNDDDRPVRIPVFFVDPAGGLAAEPWQGKPCIRVVFHYDTKAGTGERVIYGVKETVALLDTGANLIFADPTLIAGAGCPAVGTATVAGATSTIQSTTHSAHLLFPAFGTQIGITAVSTPLLQQGRAYGLILGMRFLEFGTLHLDFPRGEFWFDYDPTSGDRIHGSA